MQERSARPTPKAPGERLTGPPAQAAAEAFGHSTATQAELNVAAEIAAQAFPRTEQKPPTIDVSGEVRSSAGIPPARPHDAGQDRSR